MKINKLQDIDLTEYKLGYFQGDSMSDDKLCQDDVMAIADSDSNSERLPYLSIALIPKNISLNQCRGDDWDDIPAKHNATGFYDYPKGTICLNGTLGGELILSADLDNQ